MPPPADTDPAPVARLHPIRSLVIGGEDSFRAHVLAVIADLGPVAFASAGMTGAEDAADVVALVRHECPDVVLLDATGRETGVHGVLAALAEALGDVGVVIVCEHSTPAARRLGALPKWGWTQDLRGAVERAFVNGRSPARSPAGPLAGWSEQGPLRPD